MRLPTLLVLAALAALVAAAPAKGAHRQHHRHHGRHARGEQDPRADAVPAEGQDPEPEIEAGHAHEQLADAPAAAAAGAPARPPGAPAAPAAGPQLAPQPLHERLDAAAHGLAGAAQPLLRAPDPVAVRAGDPAGGGGAGAARLSARVSALSRELDEAGAALRAASAQAAARGAALAAERAERARAAAAHAGAVERATALRAELEGALRERGRAFDELLEEKRLLHRVVRDEQRQLLALQAKIRDPSLGAWLRRRAERAAVLLDSPETDAVAYYARLYMRPRVARMRARLAALERSVERSVDHVLPARYGAPVAAALVLALVAFPLAVAARVTLSLSRGLSLRQYVLLCNVFLVALAFACCAARVALGQDPLQTLYEASEQAFMLLQFLIGAAFPAFMVLLAATVVRSRREGNAYIFACEFVFYVMVGLNYRKRVWQPAMLGENIHANATMYVVYLIDFICMTVLTVSAAKGTSRLAPATFHRNANIPYLPTRMGKQTAAGRGSEGSVEDPSESKRSN